MQKVTLIGRLGKDPESRQANSQTVANFSVATTEKWKDKSGEKKESTEWHNIVMWGALAGVAVKYLHKGDLIYLEGKLKTRSWEKDGVTRYTTEIIASVLEMLSTKRESSSESGSSQQQSNSGFASAPEVTTDDLPF